MEAQILSAQSIEDRLRDLDVAWTAIGNDYLIRVVPSRSFRQSADLALNIVRLAEERQASPKLTIEAGKLTIELATVEVAGITADDFAFAQAIDSLAQ